MKFARTELLFLIWTIPVLWLLFLYGMRKRRRVLDRFASRKGQQAIVTGGGIKRPRIKAGLVLIALLTAVIAMAGPRYGYRWEDVERRGVDIIVALDCSRSMMATDISPTRLDRAKREVVDLLNMLQGDRVGLVAFAGTAFLQCPLTIDYDTFHLFLGALTPDFLPAGGTRLNDAVTTALDGFNKKDHSDKAIILITDGEPTGEDPSEAVARAAKEGVKIFSIGVGGKEGVPVPDGEGGLKKDRSGNIVLTRLNEETLKKMAVETGGAYVRSVAGERDLKEIYQGRIREKMAAATLTSRRRQVWNDRYQWVLAVAVLALLVDLFLPAGRKPRHHLLLLCLYLLMPMAHAQAMDFKTPMEKGLEAYDEASYDTALKHFIRAQLDDPERPEIFYNIGTAHYRTGDYESALHSFDQALKSENPEVRKNAHYNKGNAHFRLNQYDEAIADYQAALEIDPDDRDARLNLEFVKKRLEQQDSQKQEGGKKDMQKKGEKGKTAPQAKPGDKHDRPDERNDPARGKDTEKDQRPDTSQEKYGQSADPEEVPAEAASTKENRMTQAPTRPKNASSPTESERRQAEQVLNRLKDMPGKAMVPAYIERPVEKDW